MDLPPLFAATEAGLHALNGRGAIAFAGRQVTALTRRDGWWWAILERRELWSRGPGRGWARRAAVPALTAHCVLAEPGGALVGTSEAHLLRWRRGELRRVSPFDAMAGRNAWFTPWGGPPDVRSMARGAGGALYVNVHVGGVARSLDRGERWEATIDVDADVHQVVAHPTRAGTVLAASAAGLAVSHDRGTTWSFATAGFHALYQRAVALAGEVVLVSASRSERGERAAVYRRLLGGDGPFEKCAAGLPQWFADNVDTHCIAAEGAAAAIGTSDGSVFVSDDAGRTWASLRAGLPKVRALAFGLEARRGAR